MEPISSPACPAPNRSIPFARLQQLFDQHLQILKEHHDLWSSLQGHQSPGARSYLASQSCLDRTQEMIQNFQHLTTSFDQTASTTPPAESPGVSPRLKRVAPPEIASPPSDDLALSPRSAKKRRLQYSKQGEDNDNLASFAEKQHNSSLKGLDTACTTDREPNLSLKEQVRSSNQNMASSLPIRKQVEVVDEKTTTAVEPADSRSVEDQVTNGHHIEINGITLIAQGAEAQDGLSFLEKVKRHHEQKQEQRKKKSEKKRKRNSEVSVGSHEVQDTSGPIKKRLRKRLIQPGTGGAQEQSEKVETISKKRGMSTGRQHSKRQKTG